VNFSTVAAQIGVAYVICQDEDDIGFVGSCDQGKTEEAGNEKAIKTHADA